VEERRPGLGSNFGGRRLYHLTDVAWRAPCRFSSTTARHCHYPPVHDSQALDSWEASTIMQPAVRSESLPRQPGSLVFVSYLAVPRSVTTTATATATCSLSPLTRLFDLLGAHSCSLFQRRHGSTKTKEHDALSSQLRSMSKVTDSWPIHFPRTGPGVCAWEGTMLSPASLEHRAHHDQAIFFISPVRIHKLSLKVA
jgi:hypothetical protein